MLDPISEYLHRKDMTQSELAERCGVSKQSVNDFVKGRYYMGRGNALKIQTGTRGAISIQDLLTWEFAA